MSKGDAFFWRHPARPLAKAALPSPYGGQTETELRAAHCGLQGLEGFSMRAAMLLPIAKGKESFRSHVAGHRHSSTPCLLPVSSHTLCVRGLDKSLFSTWPVTQNVFLESGNCSFRLFLGLRRAQEWRELWQEHPHSLGLDISGHMLMWIYI